MKKILAERKNKMEIKDKDNKEKINGVLNSIIEMFKAGDVPKAIAISLFPKSDIPMANWSMANRIIAAINKTSDARGFKAWQSVGRHVKAGAKAFYILAPRMITRKNKEIEEEERIPIGFFPIAVFRKEDTEGKEIKEVKPEIPNFPLLEKAKEWGIKVEAVVGKGECRGAYFPKEKRIEIATPSEKTFFHELAHVAHEKIKGKLVMGQNAEQEIIAELSAQVLCQLCGKDTENTMGNSFVYIERYASEMKKDVGRACLKVLSEVEKVLKIILE